MQNCSNIFAANLLICRNMSHVWPLPFLLMSSLLLAGLRAVWNRTDWFTFAITATLRFLVLKLVNAVQKCKLGDNAT